MNIDDITDLTVNALSGLGFDAYKSYAPSLALEQVKELKVYVMPSKVEYETLARGATQQIVVYVDCGFYAAEPPLAVPTFISAVNSLAPPSTSSL